MPEKTDPALEPLLTVKQVADIWNTSTRTVLRRIKAGDLRAIVDGRIIRIPPSELRRHRRQHLLGDDQ